MFSETVSKTVAEKFGELVVSDNKLSKSNLTKYVFNNKVALAWLNDLLHPLVKQEFDKWLLKQDASYILKEAAILFETGIYKSLHKTILVSAPQETRIERVIKRDNTNQEEVLSRMNNQWSEEKKTELADYVIDNSGNKLVIPQVLEIIKQILK